MEPKTQDGRRLRRYQRRWKVERLNTWLQNYPPVLMRQKYHLEIYLGCVYMACMIVLLRRL